MAIFRLKKKPKSSANGSKEVSQVEPWRQELKDLADIYSGLETTQHEIRIAKKNQMVFDQLAELEAQKEEVKIKIQTIARARSKQGRQVSLINLPYITVHVNGNEGSRQFDLQKALKHWPESVLNQVLRVDAGKVETLIAQELAAFPETLALKAALPREAKTPAVFIKYIPEGVQSSAKKRKVG